MDETKSCAVCKDSLQLEFEKVNVELKNLITKSKELADDAWKEWSDKLVIFLHDQCKLNYMEKSPLPKRRKLMSRAHSAEVDQNTTTSISSSASIISESTDYVVTTATSVTCTSQPIIHTSTNEVYDESTSTAGSSAADGENSSAFNFAECCLFCTNKLDKKHKKVFAFSSTSTEENIMNAIQNSPDEDLENIIDRVRLAFASHTKPIQYHGNCYKNLSKVSFLLY